MRILITGGAGYIGAVTAKHLTDLGHDVLVYDHFVTHEPRKLDGIPYVKGGLLDARLLTKTITKFKPDVVMHFAAYIKMNESVRDPRKYYDNNVIGSLNLIETMIKAGCHKLVFASTAGVYGNLYPSEALAKGGSPLLREDSCLEPTNPYGETKLAIERLLKWYDKAYGFRSISIRFFNAAGAVGSFGEDHQGESHIIPNVIKAQLEDREFTLFGNDYPTIDGSCVRDYIHVQDLAEAFHLAAKKLIAGAATTCYNAGTGVGYSNLEVVKMIEKISGKPVKFKFAARREGDADTLVADSSRLRSELGWSPTSSDLETIVRSAYLYHTKNLVQ